MTYWLKFHQASRSLDRANKNRSERNLGRTDGDVMCTTSKWNCTSCFFVDDDEWRDWKMYHRSEQNNRHFYHQTPPFQFWKARIPNTSALIQRCVWTNLFHDKSLFYLSFISLQANRYRLQESPWKHGHRIGGTAYIDGFDFEFCSNHK